MDCCETVRTDGKVCVVASSQSWIEGEALQQLEKTAEWPGMLRAVGLPDLHPGKGVPIGAAFLSRGMIYPGLVGNDIGCGMGLWKTSLKARKFKADDALGRLSGLESPWDVAERDNFLRRENRAPSRFDDALGTIGGGNHFAELQSVETLVNRQAAESLGIGRDRLYLLVHSGSRGLGSEILNRHLEQFGAAGLPVPSGEAESYLEQHGEALAWAEANRAAIAERFLDCVRGQGDRLLDIFHNFVQPRGDGLQPDWLHRKGATPSDMGAVVIPGSRGSFSYLVLPTGSQERNLYTLAHGAGRKWSRGDTLQKLGKRYRTGDLEKTALGSWVICEDKSLLFEEAPEAYKNIDRVIRDLTEAGLAEVVAVFRPVITYKTRKR